MDSRFFIFFIKILYNVRVKALYPSRFRVDPFELDQATGGNRWPDSLN